MSSEELMDKLGPSGKINKEDKKTVIKYELTKKESSEFLQRLNSPNYSASYTFENDELIEAFWGL
jgi:hypothetical protein